MTVESNQAAFILEAESCKELKGQAAFANYAAAYEKLVASMQAGEAPRGARQKAVAREGANLLYSFRLNKGARILAVLRLVDGTLRWVITDICLRHDEYERKISNYDFSRIAAIVEESVSSTQGGGAAAEDEGAAAGGGAAKAEDADAAADASASVQDVVVYRGSFLVNTDGQTDCIRAIQRKIAQDAATIIVTGPAGSGKSYVACEVIKQLIATDKKVLCMTELKALRKQLRSEWEESPECDDANRESVSFVNYVGALQAVGVIRNAAAGLEALSESGKWLAIKDSLAEFFQRVVAEDERQTKVARKSEGGGTKACGLLSTITLGQLLQEFSVMAGTFDEYRGSSIFPNNLTLQEKLWELYEIYNATLEKEGSCDIRFHNCGIPEEPSDLCLVADEFPDLTLQQADNVLKLFRWKAIKGDDNQVLASRKNIMDWVVKKSSRGHVELLVYQLTEALRSPSCAVDVANKVLGCKLKVPVRRSDFADRQLFCLSGVEGDVGFGPAKSEKYDNYYRDPSTVVMTHASRVDAVRQDLGAVIVGASQDFKGLGFERVVIVDLLLGSMGKINKKTLDLFLGLLNDETLDKKNVETDQLEFVRYLHKLYVAIMRSTAELHFVFTKKLSPIMKEIMRHLVGAQAAPAKAQKPKNEPQAKDPRVDLAKWEQQLERLRAQGVAENVWLPVLGKINQVRLELGMTQYQMASDEEVEPLGAAKAASKTKTQRKNGKRRKNKKAAKQSGVDQIEELRKKLRKEMNEFLQKGFSELFVKEVSSRVSKEENGINQSYQDLLGAIGPAREAEDQDLDDYNKLLLCHRYLQSLQVLLTHPDAKPTDSMLTVYGKKIVENTMLTAEQPLKNKVFAMLAKLKLPNVGQKYDVIKRKVAGYDLKSARQVISSMIYSHWIKTLAMEVPDSDVHRDISQYGLTEMGADLVTLSEAEKRMDGYIAGAAVTNKSLVIRFLDNRQGMKLMYTREVNSLLYLALNSNILANKIADTFWEIVSKGETVIGFLAALSEENFQLLIELAGKNARIKHMLLLFSQSSRSDLNAFKDRIMVGLLEQDGDYDAWSKSTEVRQSVLSWEGRFKRILSRIKPSDGIKKNLVRIRMLALMENQGVMSDLMLESLDPGIVDMCLESGYGDLVELLRGAAMFATDPLGSEDMNDLLTNPVSDLIDEDVAVLIVRMLCNMPDSKYKQADSSFDLSEYKDVISHLLKGRDSNRLDRQFQLKLRLLHKSDFNFDTACVLNQFLATREERRFIAENIPVVILVEDEFAADPSSRSRDAVRQMVELARELCDSCTTWFGKLTSSNIRSARWLKHLYQLAERFKDLKSRLPDFIYHSVVDCHEFIHMHAYILPPDGFQVELDAGALSYVFLSDILDNLRGYSQQLPRELVDTLARYIERADAMRGALGNSESYVFQPASSSEIPEQCDLIESPMSDEYINSVLSRGVNLLCSASIVNIVLEMLFREPHPDHIKNDVIDASPYEKVASLLLPLQNYNTVVSRLMELIPAKIKNELRRLGTPDAFEKYICSTVFGRMLGTGSGGESLSTRFQVVLFALGKADVGLPQYIVDEISQLQEDLPDVLRSLLDDICYSMRGAEASLDPRLQATLYLIENFEDKLLHPLPAELKQSYSAIRYCRNFIYISYGSLRNPSQGSEVVSSLRNLRQQLLEYYPLIAAGTPRDTIRYYLKEVTTKLSDLGETVPEFDSDSDSEYGFSVLPTSIAQVGVSSERLNGFLDSVGTTSDEDKCLFLFEMLTSPVHEDFKTEDGVSLSDHKAFIQLEFTLQDLQVKFYDFLRGTDSHVMAQITENSVLCTLVSDDKHREFLRLYPVLLFGFRDRILPALGRKIREVSTGLSLSDLVQESYSWVGNPTLTGIDKSTPLRNLLVAMGAYSSFKDGASKSPKMEEGCSIIRCQELIDWVHQEWTLEDSDSSTDSVAEKVGQVVLELIKIYKNIANETARMRVKEYIDQLRSDLIHALENSEQDEAGDVEVRAQSPSAVSVFRSNNAGSRPSSPSSALSSGGGAKPGPSR